MTNTVAYAPKKQNGNGVTKDVSFAWKIFKETDLIIIIENDITKVQRTLELGTDYSVTFSGGTGGNVSLVVAPPTGETIIVTRNTPQEQGSSYLTSPGFDAKEVEKSLDRASVIVQDVNYSLKRAIKVPIGSEALNLSLPAPNAGKTLKWNETEDGLVNSDVNVDDIDTAVQEAKDYADAAINSANSATASAASAASGIAVFNTTYEGALQDLVDGKEEIETQAILSLNQLRDAGYGLPPSICKNLMIKKVGVNVSLKWEDSGNTILDEKYICTWAGTKIVKRLGGYPRNETDGVLVVDNLINNQYLNSAYIDVLADSGENWYYAAFPYSTNGAYCYNAKNNFTEAIVYEFCINPNDANPITRVTRPVDSVNKDFVHAYMNFGSGAFNYGSWEHAFFMPRPVMVKYDGTVDYELYKQNFNYKADGVTPSGIANTAYGGNVMIAFPQVWFKFVMDGTLQHVYIANKQVDENYKCYTHYNRLGTLLNEIFINAYQPCNVSSKLRSLSGQTIYVGAAGTTEIAYAQANGDGWYLWDYAFFNMMNMLLVLMCGSTNIQSKFGEGRSSAANATTGECNDKGMFYGTSANGAVKIFGIENYYGNYWKRTAGCVYTAAGMKYKMTESTLDGSTVVGYNTDGTGYLTHQAFSGTTGGYISAASLTANGIFPTVASGSSSTYFSDGLWWAAGGYAIVGGDYADGALAGSFCLFLSDAVSTAGANIGASLSCKPL